MSKTDQDAVGKGMENVANGMKGEELFFDPDSGMLEVSVRGERVNDPDRVPATEMAREGFFADKIR